MDDLSFWLVGTPQAAAKQAADNGCHGKSFGLVHARQRSDAPPLRVGLLFSCSANSSTRKERDNQAPSLMLLRVPRQKAIVLCHLAALTAGDGKL